jgi:hypothetical protein
LHLAFSRYRPKAFSHRRGRTADRLDAGATFRENE